MTDPNHEKRDAEIYGREPVGMDPPEAPIDRGGPFIRGTSPASQGKHDPDNHFIRAKRDAAATTNRPRRFPGEAD